MRTVRSILRFRYSFLASFCHSVFYTDAFGSRPSHSRLYRGCNGTCTDLWRMYGTQGCLLSLILFDRLVGSWSRGLESGVWDIGREGDDIALVPKDAKRSEKYSKVAGTLLQPSVARRNAPDDLWTSGPTAAHPEAGELLPPPRSPHGRTYRPDSRTAPSKTCSA